MTDADEGTEDVDWFKVESGIRSHRKTRLIPRERVDVPLRTAAMGVWLMAAAWTAKEESDGFVPAEVLEQWDPTGVAIKALVDCHGEGDAGYFVEAVVRGEVGYQLHDWEDRQMTAADLATQRQRWATKKAEQRRKAAGQQLSLGDDDPDPPGPPDGPPGGLPDGVPGTVPGGLSGGVFPGKSDTLDSGGHPEAQDRTTPGMSDSGDLGHSERRSVSAGRANVPGGHPDGLRKTESKSKNLTTTSSDEDVSDRESPGDTTASGRRRHGYSPEFEEFWAAYPSRGGDAKHPASLKFQAALKLPGVTAPLLVEAAKRYAAERRGQDPTYTAMAKTWLSQRRWENVRQGPLRVVGMGNRGGLVQSRDGSYVEKNW